MNHKQVIDLKYNEVEVFYRNRLFYLPLLKSVKYLLLFLFLFPLCTSLFAQDGDVLWDFGLRNSIKWYNGRAVSIKNPTNELPLDIYPHFHQPAIGLVFTIYPRKIEGFGFETNLDYSQFNGVIKSRSSGYFDMADIQRDIITLHENIKYVLVFKRSSVDYSFQPFAGFGIGFVPSPREINVSPAPLRDEIGIESLGQRYELGFRPIHNTTFEISNTILTMAFGLDFEVRVRDFSIGTRLGYDLGINRFYRQTISYKYNQVPVEQASLRYYNSGFNLGVTLKYLFRN